ncbi:TetR/AcrR family transcriptional regulator [Nonomuraea sp. NPDC059194]|uniref:TetR/AcrR family transcriptional regulator n=1 Tax=Nonomuraea sp. NPDC059194 TaxID=3346764 RepID=UPI003679BEEB
MAREHRRLDRPREQVLEAAMAAIAEHGLADLTMAGLARRLGTSGGHILYYFGSKDQVLVETLRWSEERLAPRRAALVGRPAPADAKVAEYIDLYLPTGTADPRWLLWVDVWSRTLAVPELRQAQAELDQGWHEDLVRLVDDGVRAGEYMPIDAEAFSVRLRAMLDGFSTQIVIGVPGVDRATFATHALDYTRQTLTAHR